ncbi:MULTISPECIES: glycoside hydrolase family 32 protein [Arthrobacter]|uniref:Glycoside hydrolase family 32 protein n=2 Tax=Arthrobacter TaxID=1663 RepID=A0ABU9KFU0_9MICC|nr:glycoside hydrolase family 32 protein [Arthrobacter sp. YJM1]MDP5225742.1 glycoside hydrolase family 32 protein [Arthrobacter sp. YJM1]
MSTTTTERRSMTVSQESGAEPFAAEAFRPLIHYTAADRWINDPNGLVHHGGLYHLFFQYNPYGTDHGFMSWGHAVSPDLVRWEDRPVAILCDEDEQIFSGSAVVDSGNSAGFGPDGSSPLVAVYTSHYSDSSPYPKTQAQSLAYSLDGGESWTKHHGNPVLNRGSSDFRDPKVFRYQGPAGEYWVMVAVEAVDRKVVLYRSLDLKDWTYLSEFTSTEVVGQIWECPDLFPLALDGDPDEVRWVLVVSFNQEEGNGGSKGIYFIGDFDGTRFTSAAAENARQAEWEWLDHGRDYYAAVSFNDAPEGRRIMIGWMNNWEYAKDLPTNPWRGSMSVARDLSLHREQGRLVLRQRPAALPDSAGIAVEVPPLAVLEGCRSLPALPSGQAARLEVRLVRELASEMGLVLRAGEGEETVLGYDVETEELFLDRRWAGGGDLGPFFASRESAPLTLDDGGLGLTVILDAGSVEVFAGDGRCVITDQIFSRDESVGLYAYAKGGSARIEGFSLTPLAAAPVIRR